MLSDFFKGIAAYRRALGLIARLRLWGYFFVPAFISMLFGVGIYYGALDIASRFDDWVLDWYPWEWGRSIIEGISYWMGLIVVWGTALLVFRHIVVALCSPFMSPLSQRVEEYLTNRKIQSKFSLSKTISDFIRGLRIAIRNIIRELGFTFILLILAMMVPLLAPFTTILILIIQIYYAGFGNMDYTLERYFGVSGSAYFVRQNKGLALGNGAVFVFLIFTVVGVFIAPPLATVAATLTVVPRLDSPNYELEEHELLV